MDRKLLNLFDALIEGQKEKLLERGRTFVPQLTPEDMLQPNDFDELEHNPYFRYEEGILDGIQLSKSALLACLKDLGY